MELNKAARRYYTLELTATDETGTAISNPSYDASFDGGVTWKPGSKNVTTGWWEWLVAGPLADPTGAAAIISTTWVVPIVRLIDSPEIDAEDVPVINLVG